MILLTRMSLFFKPACGELDIVVSSVNVRCLCLRPDLSIASTFMHGFQINLAQFSLTNRSAI